MNFHTLFLPAVLLVLVLVSHQAQTSPVPDDQDDRVGNAWHQDREDAVVHLTRRADHLDNTTLDLGQRPERSDHLDDDDDDSEFFGICASMPYLCQPLAYSHSPSKVVKRTTYPQAVTTNFTEAG